MSLPPPPVDRGYLNLVSHLNASTTNLPLTTITGSIAHYLARAYPSATSLAAIVVSSPLFRAPDSSRTKHAYTTYDALDGLLTAFRHAAHIKLKLLNEQPSGIWERSVRSRFDTWVREVVKGLEGARHVIRLACLAGLLTGYDDLTKVEDAQVRNGRARRRVEEETVVALAEVLGSADSGSAAVDPWEKEFKSLTGENDDVLPVALIVASRALPLVASSRLKALPLATLCRALQSSILSAFQDGKFLQHDISSSSNSSSSPRILSIPSSSPFAQNIDSLSKSLLLKNMASFSALSVLLLSLLAEYRPSSETWTVVADIVSGLDGTTSNIETDWTASGLAGIEDDNVLDAETKAVATQVWTILKTILFTCIRLSQQVLTTALFVSTPAMQLESNRPPSTPFSVTLTILSALSHLSFVLPTFGSVSSTSSSSLPELLKAFYTALDILSSSPSESARYIAALRAEVDLLRGKDVARNVLKAKEAFALACTEQLVPVLEDAIVRTEVWSLTEPHLNDPSHRETYESAHSVMLAVLSSHAKRAESPSQAMDAGPVRAQVPFAEQIVPMYARCLVENSYPEKLTPTQLRMAFRALVACASAFGTGRRATERPRQQVASIPNNGSESTTSVEQGRTVEGDAYAWFCIDLLLSTIRSIHSSPQTPEEMERKKNLTLALISSVSSVSLRVLPKLLEEIVQVLQQHEAVKDATAPQEDADIDEREEYAQALFEELVSVGDEQREFALRWWGENKHRLRSGKVSSTSEEAGPEADAKGKGKEVVARL